MKKNRFEITRSTTTTTKKQHSDKTISISNSVELASEEADKIDEETTEIKRIDIKSKIRIDFKANYMKCNASNA